MALPAAAAMSIRRTLVFPKNGQMSLLARTNGWSRTPLHMRQCNSPAAAAVLLCTGDVLKESDAGCAAQLNASDTKMEMSACSGSKTSARWNPIRNLFAALFLSSIGMLINVQFC